MHIHPVPDYKPTAQYNKPNYVNKPAANNLVNQSGSGFLGSIKAKSVAIIAAVVVFDMMHPDVFWQMRNCLDVEGGRPSDYFRFMQKLSWKISPFIIISLMIASFVIEV